MSELTLNIEGVRGDALKRYAAFANKTPEGLVMEWIKETLDNTAIQVLRANGKTWEEVSELLGYSVTQCRRIYLQGQDMPPVSREDIRLMERYVELVERAAKVKLSIPSEADLEAIEKYCNAIQNLPSSLYGKTATKKAGANPPDILSPKTVSGGKAPATTSKRQLI